MKANAAAEAGGFTPIQIVALAQFVAEMWQALEAQQLDDRIFEGDDQNEINGY